MEQEPKGKVKTKVRFTSLDTAAMVAELQGLVGMRITNIYDISPTTYLLKFTGH
jgi:predicted ribosome quality control (RQC) complex YloA/Tae2 family protein